MTDKTLTTPRNPTHSAREVVAQRYPGRWISALVMAALTGLVAHSMITNPNFDWSTVGKYLFSPTILTGLWTTFWLTLVIMLLAIVLSVMLAVMRLSSNPLLVGFSRGWIWFFRGTPVLVQLIFWYNLSTLFPTISITIPWTDITFASWNTNDLITPLTAAIAGLALNEAAYMAEIIRAGLLSVDNGQVETTQAFGMSRSRALRRVIIPQAMRSIIPPTGNQLISMIKATSLVSVIAMGDLLYSVQAVYNRTFEIIPMLMVAVIWYLLITSILNVGQSAIERYYARGSKRTVVVNKRRASSDTALAAAPRLKEDV